MNKISAVTGMNNKKKSTRQRLVPGLGSGYSFGSETASGGSYGFGSIPRWYTFQPEWHKSGLANLT